MSATKQELLDAADLAERAAKRVGMGWCQIEVAMSADGRSVAATDPHACQWCAFGALKVEAEPTNGQYILAHDLISKANGPDFNLITFSDTPGRTQQEVIDLLNSTAVSLRQSAQEMDTQ